MWARVSILNVVEVRLGNCAYSLVDSVQLLTFFLETGPHCSVFLSAVLLARKTACRGTKTVHQEQRRYMQATIYSRVS